MKMFDHIHEVADDPEQFVCILIDEVESLTRSRTEASSGNEPGDAIRVVNAVLTALDALRRQPNVLVLCTSNMIEGIDPAFRDRLDVCIHVGPPTPRARRAILRSCLDELTRKGIIQSPSSSSSSLSSSSLSPSHLEAMDHGVGGEEGGDESRSNNVCTGGIEEVWSIDGQLLPSVPTHPLRPLLESLITKSEGTSGRALRKLAVRAHAYYLQKPTVPLAVFLEAMGATLALPNGGS
jgi:hypothetical protein